MRVRLVARLLAVTLASPVVAFTSPGEGLTRVEAPPAAATSEAVTYVKRPRVAQPPVVRVPPPAPAEVRISVDCGHDGCVVQEGLAVLVVGDAPRSPSPVGQAVR